MPRLFSSFWLVTGLCLAIGAGGARADGTADVARETPGEKQAASEVKAAGDAKADSAVTAKPVAEPEKMPVRADVVTLVIGGDLGFGGSAQPVVAGHGVRHGKRHAHEDLTRQLKPLLRADLVFANLETVVTERNSLAAWDKTFTFRMHPSGVAHLVEAGFNLLSTANNHTVDYGRGGMEDTLRHLEALKATGLRAAAGLGANYGAAVAPAMFELRDHRFALSAIGIGGMRPTATAPGQPAYRNNADFAAVVERLRSAPAAYRMLSVHYGAELQVAAASDDARKLRSAVEGENGVDLVIGHHAHVAAGVQRIGPKLIFYGLGNLLHLGMQDMGRFNECRDFGLLGRLYLQPAAAETGRLEAVAVEIIPLTDMHLFARPLVGEAGRRRIEVINHLAAGLDDEAGGASGLSFVPQDNGRGLYCFPEAAKAGGELGQLCKGWQPPEPLAKERRASIVRACGSTAGREVRVSQGRKAKPGRDAAKPAATTSSGLPPFAAAAFGSPN